MPMRVFAAVVVATALPSFAEGKFQRLHPDEAVASSFLKNDWNKYTENYHPNYALDDDPATAWVEGASGNGPGETITLRFSPLASARALRVRLRNGYQKSKGLHAANAAPKRVRFALLDSAGEEVHFVFHTLTRSWGWQQVELKPRGQTQITFLQLRIDSAHPGSRYKDTCLSDVQILVDSKVPYNAKAEAAKRDALKGWIKGRRATAKYFANLPKKYPFAATHFEERREFEQQDPSYTHPDTPEAKKVEGFVPLDKLVEVQTYPAAWTRLFDQARTVRIRRLMELARTNGEGLGEGWHQPALKGRIELPDGLSGEPWEEVVNYLSRDNFALFEASAATTQKLPEELERMEGMVQRYEASQVKVAFSAPAQKTDVGKVEGGPIVASATPRVRDLYFWRHSVIEERGVYEERRHILISFDDQERPQEVLQLAVGSSGWTVTALAFELNPEDRVNKVTVRRAAYAAVEEHGHYSSNSFHQSAYVPVTRN